MPPLPDDLTSSMNNQMQIKPWWACSDPLPYPTLPCDVAVDALKITTQRANPSHILATICVVGSKGWKETEGGKVSDDCRDDTRKKARHFFSNKEEHRHRIFAVFSYCHPSNFSEQEWKGSLLSFEHCLDLSYTFLKKIRSSCRISSPAPCNFSSAIACIGC